MEIVAAVRYKTSAKVVDHLTVVCCLLSQKYGLLGKQ